MSEAGMITSNPLRGERRAGTVGAPLPGVEIRVRDSEGRIVPAGSPGVLEIRGPNVFSGYWRNEEKTRESFTADGFFVTGDVVVVDASGTVSIVGREKDLIISGGLNVYPREIEAEIDTLPGVRESAVVGVSHPDFGEGVIAVVDRSASGPDEAAVIAALRGRLAAFKLPKRVFFVDELPRNAMGKVQKNVLRARYADTFRA
jgi:malonyl-CoA/methylmalonyl-CoA synthetase